MNKLLVGLVCLLSVAGGMALGYELRSSEAVAEAKASYADGKLAGEVELKEGALTMGCVHGKQGDLELMICHKEPMAFELTCEGLGEAAAQDPSLEKLGCYPAAAILK